MTMRSNERNVRKRGGGAKKLLAVSATAILASLAVAVPVFAATPPVLPREITIFPERDFVVADGYRANTVLNFSVIRGADVVGTARGTTDSTGFVEVNHPGGVCWNAPTTPDIQPGDRVQVRNANFNINDSSRTINVQINKDDPATPGVDESGAATIADGPDNLPNTADDTVVVKGTAVDAAAPNGRVPIARMEQRIIQPDFIVANPGPDDSNIGRRDIRADSLGGRVENGNPDAEGNLVYDSPTSTSWTATYTGLNAAERDLAVQGQSRVLSWLAVQRGERAGITIFEAGEAGGPGFGGCPPGPAGAIGPNPPDAPVQYDNPPPNDYLEGVIPNLLSAESIAADGSLTPAQRDAQLSNLHDVVVFPERDFVVAEGDYPDGTDLNFVVRRPVEGGGTAVIGTARGTTTGGILEANHPGGECWTGQTPDIKPGDVVDVVEYNDFGTEAVSDDLFVSGETQRTINVTAGDAVRNRNGTLTNLNDDRLVIKGTAVNPDAPNGRVPIEQLEQRIINPDLNLTRIGRRDIRADSQGGRVENVPGGSGSLVYDSPTSTNWTATYRGLNDNEIKIALEGQVRILSWLAADTAGERYGITIFEVGEGGGPGFGGCPQTGDFSLPLPKP